MCGYAQMPADYHLYRTKHYVYPHQPEQLQAQFVSPDSAGVDIYSEKIIELRGRFLGKKDNRLRVIWNFRTPEDYDYVELDGNALQLRDVIDEFKGRASVELRLGQRKDGQETVLRSAPFECSARWLREPHTLRIHADKHEVKATFGERFLTDTISISIPETPVGENFRIEFASPFEVVQLFRTVRRDDNNVASMPMRDVVAALIRAQGNDPHPGVGLWRYEGRINEPRTATAGGNYLLAIIPDSVTTPGEERYRIVYLDGAEVYRDSWHPGMIKGELRRGLFSDNLALKWLDSHMKPAPQEARAILENNDLMSLMFADLGITLKFGRVPAVTAADIIAKLSDPDGDCR